MGSSSSCDKFIIEFPNSTKETLEDKLKLFGLTNKLITHNNKQTKLDISVIQCSSVKFGISINILDSFLVSFPKILQSLSECRNGFSLTKETDCGKLSNKNKNTYLNLFPESTWLPDDIFEFIRFIISDDTLFTPVQNQSFEAKTEHLGKLLRLFYHLVEHSYPLYLRPRTLEKFHYAIDSLNLSYLNYVGKITPNDQIKYLRYSWVYTYVNNIVLPPHNLFPTSDDIFTFAYVGKLCSEVKENELATPICRLPSSITTLLALKLSTILVYPLDVYSNLTREEFILLCKSGSEKLLNKLRLDDLRNLSFEVSKDSKNTPNFTDLNKPMGALTDEEIEKLRKIVNSPETMEVVTKGYDENKINYLIGEAIKIYDVINSDEFALIPDISVSKTKPNKITDVHSTYSLNSLIILYALMNTDKKEKFLPTNGSTFYATHSETHPSIPSRYLLSLPASMTIRLTGGCFSEQFHISNLTSNRYLITRENKELFSGSMIGQREKLAVPIYKNKKYLIQYFFVRLRSTEKYLLSNIRFHSMTKEQKEILMKFDSNAAAVQLVNLKRFFDSLNIMPEIDQSMKEKLGGLKNKTLKEIRVELEKIVGGTNKEMNSEIVNSDVGLASRLAFKKDIVTDLNLSMSENYCLTNEKNSMMVPMMMGMILMKFFGVKWRNAMKPKVVELFDSMGIDQSKVSEVAHKWKMSSSFDWRNPLNPTGFNSFLRYEKYLNDDGTTFERMRLSDNCVNDCGKNDSILDVKEFFVDLKY